MRRSWPSTGGWPTTTSRSPRYQEFCATSLAHVDELMLDWISSAEFDGLLVETVRATYPKHEQEQFLAHFRGLLGLWVHERGRTPRRSRRFTPEGGGIAARACHPRALMMKRIAVPLLLTGALALTACGADDPAGTATSANAPTPAELLTKAITESTDQTSAAFALTASVTGASDDPQVQPFLAQPLKAEISGKASAKAVDISGKATVSGQDFQLGVRADEQQSFIQFMNTWYGPDKGITGATESTRPIRPSSSRRC